MKVVIDIIGCIEKNILMEKMAFLMMLNVCFDEGQISWNNIFFLRSEGISFTIITYYRPRRNM